jgi:hypothetical protein
VVDVRDGWHKAQRLNPGCVREPGGGVDQGEAGDRLAVEAKQVQSLLGASDVHRSDEGRGRRLHLDDDREECERPRVHQGLERWVDLVGRGSARRRCRWEERKHKRDEHAGDSERPVRSHADRSAG